MQHLHICHLLPLVILSALTAAISGNLVNYITYKATQCHCRPRKYNISLFASNTAPLSLKQLPLFNSLQPANSNAV